MRMVMPKFFVKNKLTLAIRFNDGRPHFCRSSTTTIALKHSIWKDLRALFEILEFNVQSNEA